MERYGDLMYFGAGALSIIGSILVGIYAKVTRVAPEKASELATAILDIGERIAHAGSMDALDTLQDELESILRRAVIGLRNGIISSDGDWTRSGSDMNSCARRSACGANCSSGRPAMTTIW